MIQLRTPGNAGFGLGEPAYRPPSRCSRWGCEDSTLVSPSGVIISPLSLSAIFILNSVLRTISLIPLFRFTALMRTLHRRDHSSRLVSSASASAWMVSFVGSLLLSTLAPSFHLDPVMRMPPLKWFPTSSGFWRRFLKEVLADPIIPSNSGGTCEPNLD